MSDATMPPDPGRAAPRNLDVYFARALPVLRRVAPDLMGAALRQRCRTSDLVQSALAEAVASLPGFRGTGATEFVGWTLRIMENNALDRRRRLQAQKRTTDREVASADLSSDPSAPRRDSPSQLACDREQLLRIARAIRRLPVEQRRILHLVTLHGHSHAAAARILDRSEGACRVLLARARASLLVEMAKGAGHGGG